MAKSRRPDLYTLECPECGDKHLFLKRGTRSKLRSRDKLCKSPLYGWTTNQCSAMPLGLYIEAPIPA